MSEGAEPPRLDVIARLRNAAQLAFAMLAGVQLDVFTPLQDGPATCEELARAIEVGPVKLAFINIFDGGQSYTEGEHRDWLTEAGFSGIERDQLSAGTDVMLARKGDAVDPGRWPGVWGWGGRDAGR